MRPTQQLPRLTCKTILGLENPLVNHLEGMAAVGVPRIFYCNWLPEYTDEEGKIKQQIQGQYPNCCFNHMVGLPTIKFEEDDENQESAPIELMGFNQRMLESYHLHKRLSQNKCRGSGSSEMFTVRYMVFKYGVMNTVYNHKAIICAGTRLASALEFSKRAKYLCDKIPQIYETVPINDAPETIKFRTGGRMSYFPANPSAIRGQENVGDIILEECAHWNLLDDVEVYRASEFVYTKTKCHILHPTTPRGRRGFYYTKVWDPACKTNYYRDTINWREVTGLPVMKVEELFGTEIKTQEDILKIRKRCRKQYMEDVDYRNWFDEFFDGLNMRQVTNVPNIILDVNHIIEQAQNNRNDYDQELDNQFIASEYKAIGEFVEEDFQPLDLRKQIEDFDLGDYE